MHAVDKQVSHNKKLCNVKEDVEIKPVEFGSVCRKPEAKSKYGHIAPVKKKIQKHSSEVECAEKERFSDENRVHKLKKTRSSMVMESDGNKVQKLKKTRSFPMVQAEEIRVDAMKSKEILNEGNARKVLHVMKANDCAEKKVLKITDNEEDKDEAINILMLCKEEDLEHIEKSWGMDILKAYVSHLESNKIHWGKEIVANFKSGNTNLEEKEICSVEIVELVDKNPEDLIINSVSKLSNNIYKEEGENRCSDQSRHWQPCRYCDEYHKWGSQYCPAFGHRCTGCGKENHFEAVCRSIKRIQKIENDLNELEDFVKVVGRVVCKNHKEDYKLVKTGKAKKKGDDWIEVKISNIDQDTDSEEVKAYFGHIGEVKDFD